MGTSPRTKVGLYGGSFNPIHLGHTQLAQWLVDEGHVDELWFLVSPLNPLKQDTATTLLPDEVRLHLAHLAVGQYAPPPSLETLEPPVPSPFGGGKRPLKVSAFEMSLPRPSYMVNTLAALRKSYPDLDFVLVIGADNWLSFNRWYHPEEILAHHCILVYPRQGYPIDSTTLPTNVRLVPAPLFNTSSTDIRNAIHEGTCQGEWLHPKVWEEIKAKGYYAASSNNINEVQLMKQG